jgi:cytochrome c553
MIAAAALFVTALFGAGAAGAAEIPLAERKSGYEFLGRETRAMQDDDTANPAMLSVLDGETLWQRKDGSAAKSCADCHGDARTSMKGVAARYPGADDPSISRNASISAAPRSSKQRRLPSRAKNCSRSQLMSGGNRAGCRSTSRTTRA